MASIKLITDSTSDIMKAVAEQWGIRVLPLTVHFGDKSYADGVELASTDFFDMLKQSDVFPTTSQISPAAFEQAFREELHTHDTLIVVTLSSKGSGTYQSACIAKEMVLEDTPEADIVLIDSLSFCSGYGMIVVEAAKMLQDGRTKQEIIDHITNSCANLEIYILADTLEYLKKGGRVSNIAALIGGMLNIRPILTVRDGMVASKGKLRGN
ncbi:MAG: DegV family protein, partial [Hyphomonadaceae bacterium]|nr:DegV family protein [Clostridia bacterium]